MYSAGEMQALQGVYQPNAVVLQQRAELSKAFSALRRVRPRVPFWHLAAHRIPTLWSLYRGLMKQAPGGNIRWRMRMYFERYRSLTSPKATREKLLLAHKFLDAFRSAAGGDERLQKVLSRYDEMIRAKRDKEELKSMVLEELAWQERLRTRPIMTGGFLRPSVLNRPLPRLKPQPERISMMIAKRRTAYGRMGEKYVRLKNYQQDLKMERAFEDELLQDLRASSRDVSFEPVFAKAQGWGEDISLQRAAIRESLALAARRASTPYPPEMLAAIMEARREKIRNKTRERERERRGEVLRCTIERRRKGPPAHVLAKRPEWRRRADKVIRSVSEVGYVGMMKARLGIKMKNPNLWRELEEGKTEQSGDVDDSKEVQDEGGKECDVIEDSVKDSDAKEP